jgi:hypothetical protein
MATLTDGLSTTLSIGEANYVCEIEVTPPPIDGGPGIPQDCMRSGDWMRMWPRRRKKLGSITTLVSWNPDVYGSNINGNIPTLVNVNQSQLMVLGFPNGKRIGFYGVVEKFEPQAMKEGERPTANITITPTLLHPYTGAVANPTYVSSVSINTLVSGNVAP